MAVQYVCDGCNTPKPRDQLDGTKRGILGKLYCIAGEDPCLPKAQAYEDGVDAAHTEQAKAWQATRDKLRTDSALKDGAHPDE